MTDFEGAAGPRLTRRTFVRWTALGATSLPLVLAACAPAATTPAPAAPTGSAATSATGRAAAPTSASAAAAAANATSGGAVRRPPTYIPFQNGPDARSARERQRPRRRLLQVSRQPGHARSRTTRRRQRRLRHRGPDLRAAARGRPERRLASRQQAAQRQPEAPDGAHRGLRRRRQHRARRLRPARLHLQPDHHPAARRHPRAAAVRDAPAAPT